MPFPQCSFGCLVHYDETTGRRIILAISCKQWTCPDCAKALRARWVARVTAAKPDRWLTLTMVHNPGGNTLREWQRIKSGFYKLVQKIRKRFKTFEYVACYELTLKGQPHVHVLFRGTFIPQRWLSNKAVECGLGSVVYIEAIRDKKETAHYLVKYITKATETIHSVQPGLRIITASRHFFPLVDDTGPDLFPENTAWTFYAGSPEYVAHTLCIVAHLKIVPSEDDQAIILEKDLEWDARVEALHQKLAADEADRVERYYTSQLFDERRAPLTQEEVSR